MAHQPDLYALQAHGVNTLLDDEPNPSTSDRATELFMSHTATTRRNRADAMLRQRCPVCLEGKVFHSLLGMNRTCPHCGIVYERETGYFLNAMFVAYVLGFLLFAPLALILYVLHVSALWFSVIVIGSLLIVWPLIFRYSRVVWMHVDQRIDPREESGLESNSGGDPGDAGVL